MSKNKNGKRKAGRPRKDKDLDTSQILRKALQSFAKEGYGGVTISKLAENLGVADSLLHYHFGGKLALWKKATRLVGNEIYEELRQLFDVIDDIDGLEKLRLFNKKIVQTSAKYPEFQQVVVQEVFSDNPRSEWLIEELLKPIFGIMENVIKEEKKKGRIKDIPQANLTSFIIGSITTLFSRSFQMRKMHGIDPLEKEQVDLHAHLINDLIFNGLLKK